MQQGWDDAWDALGGLLFIALTAVVAGFFIALFVCGGWLIRVLRGESVPLGAEAPPAPLFGAPPGSRWLMAYDYWLFRLEQVTGIEFTTSPTGLLLGCILVSVGPSLLVGVALDLLDPASRGAWTAGLGLLGVGIGALTGRMQASPAVGWFDAPLTAHAISDKQRPGYLDLGEDDGDADSN